MLLSGLATVSPGRLTCAPGSGAGVSFGVLVAHYSTPGDNGQSCRQAEGLPVRGYFFTGFSRHQQRGGEEQSVARSS
ncbi:unnamed protein product [Knipowitschia caucasica]|uniref:Secreted protein n=1 Tax=Knipowitschia caucasica TaxID=637954 RepID=A0AAV2LGV4_KNICA